MSADQLDNASDIETAEREHMIQKARVQPKIIATGHCLWCNIEVEHGRRWCSVDCQEDWSSNEEAMRRHRGRY